MKRTVTISLTLALLMILSTVAIADTAAFDKQMQLVIDQYLKIPTQLAADKTTGVQDAAKEIAKLAGKLDAKRVTGEHASHYKNIPRNLVAAAKKLAAAKGIDAKREALKELSKPMAMWATMSKPKGVSVMYCSMAPGSWLQKDDTTVANPYYGAKMLRCGEIVSGEGAGQKDGHMKHGGGHGNH